MNADPRRRELVIRTPEGIAFAFELAGPVLRGAAFIIDLFIVAVATQLVDAVTALFRLLSQDVFGAVATLLFFALYFGYGIWTEWKLRGQTLGKRLLRLRVLDAGGLRLQFSQVVLRNLLRVVDALPVFYLVGGACCFLHPRAQRLGDIAAGTVVVRVPRIREPDLDQLETPKYNSLRDHPHLSARIRQRIGARAAAIAVQALLRRGELEPGARATLFEELTAYIRREVKIPDELLDGLSAEQVVRNVVDVLFRAPAGTGRERPVPR